MALICWIAEFLLESFAAYYAWKRQYRPLAAFLGFRALSEFICAMVLSSSGQNFYAWTWYAQSLIQYILFSWAVVWIVAALMRDNKHTLRFYSVAFASFTALAIAFFHVHSLTMTNVLHFSAAVYFFLGIFTAMALLMRKDERFVWYGIAALILCCSNGTLAAIQAAHWKVVGYYPIGEIAALSLWAWQLREQAGKRIKGYAAEWGLSVKVTRRLAR